MFVVVHTAVTPKPWRLLLRYPLCSAGRKVVTWSPVKKIYCFMVSYLCLDTWAIVVSFPGSLSHSNTLSHFRPFTQFHGPLSDSKTLSLTPRPSLGIGSQCSGTCLEWSLFKVATSPLWFPAALIL